MELEPNFPSAIPEDEMAEVLTEFYQRGQSEAKSLPPPPPFEVTTSIVQAQSRRIEEPRGSDVPDVAQPPALVAPETEVDFYMASYDTQYANPFHFSFWLRGHNQGRVSRPCYIRSYDNWWYWVQPITRERLQAHRVFPGFNGSTWTPPGPDEQALLIQVSCYLDALPPPGTFGFAGELWVNMFVEYEDTGEDMEHIYGHDEDNINWFWRYPPPRSIGVTILFD